MDFGANNPAAAEALGFERVQFPIPPLKYVTIHVWNGRGSGAAANKTMGTFNLPGDYSMGRLCSRMALKLDTHADVLEVMVPWSNVDQTMLHGNAALGLESREQFKVAGPEDQARSIGMRSGDHLWVRHLLKRSPEKKR